MKQITTLKGLVLMLLFQLLLFNDIKLYANDLSISNVQIGTIDKSNKTVNIEFTVSWKNSWRLTSSAPNNWDAAWVFIKYQEQDTDVWNHASIELSGNEVYDANTGAFPNPTISVRDDRGIGFGIGAMIHSDGTADLNNEEVTYDAIVKWNYGQDGVSDNNLFEIRVFGIEMVYINEGKYFLGSGGNESSHFYDASTSNDPYLVESEMQIEVNNTDGLYYNVFPSQVETRGDQGGPITSSFPKGFQAIYCMKYELMHGAYIDFLNSLSDPYKQQARAATTSTKRHSTNGAPNSGYTTETPYRAYNFLAWADLSAYLDWAGLRPMTELEFEKICRGPNTDLALIVNNDYAWGTTDIYAVDYVLKNDDGGKYGSVTDSTNSGNANYYKELIDRSNDMGPYRSGIFATAISTRLTSGATYYGVMQMSDNVREWVISIGNAEGRAYTGIHGDGELINGLADEFFWPDSVGTGTGTRGGSFWDKSNLLRVSDRVAAANALKGQHGHYGGRGVRNAD